MNAFTYLIELQSKIRISILILMLLFLSIQMFAQDDATRAPETIYKSSFNQNRLQDRKENLHFVCVAVDKFQDNKFAESNNKRLLDLPCSANLSILKNCPKALRKQYKNVTNTFLGGKESVGTSEIINTLNAITHKSNLNNSLVIVILASHAEYIDGKYIFYTSDSYIEGDTLVKIFNSYRNKGADVLVFIDTCHSEWLYKDQKSNGVFYIGASKYDQKSWDLHNESRFSTTLSKAFRSEINFLKRDDVPNIWADDFYNVLKQHAEKDIQTVVTSYKPEVSGNNNFPVMKNYKWSKKKNDMIWTPWKVSPTDNNWVEWTFVGLEGASVVSFFACGITQEIARNKITNLNVDDQRADKYRKMGKEAAIGCIASAGVLLVSYAGKVISTTINLSEKRPNINSVSLTIRPTATAGIQFALNF